MSYALSRGSLFSVDTYALSRRSYFSIDEYNVQSLVKGFLERSKVDNDSSSNSLFSINPYRNVPNTGLQCASSELNENSIDEVSESKPLSFKRVPRQANVKRFNFYVSIDRLYAIQVSHVVAIYALTNLER